MFEFKAKVFFTHKLQYQYNQKWQNKHANQVFSVSNLFSKLGMRIHVQPNHIIFCMIEDMSLDILLFAIDVFVILITECFTDKL